MCGPLTPKVSLRYMASQREARVFSSAPRQPLLLTGPRGPHIRLHLLEGRYAAGNHGVDIDEVPAEAGLDRSLPRTGGEPLDGLRELRPELLAEVVRRTVAVVVLEHEGIGERRGELRILGLSGELRQCLRCVVVCARPAAIRRKVEMAEAEPAGLRE